MVLLLTLSMPAPYLYNNEIKHIYMDYKNSTSSLAPAKINLFLHITGKRDDNYHLINSIFSFSDFGDIIKLSDAEKDILNISGRFANQISDVQDLNDNLVFKVVNLIRNKFNVDKYVRIDLEKNIPVGAGIGGGSSDAAATGKLLVDLWSLSLSDSELCTLLLPIGADIPSCINRKLSFISGIGEEIIDLEIDRKMPILLVNPMIHVNTADIFRMGINKYSKTIEAENIPSIEQDLISWLGNKNNDLEKNAINLFPEIGELINKISITENCRLARMSGSGSTCFGIYNNIKEAKNAANIIRNLYPDYWIKVSYCS